MTGAGGEGSNSCGELNGAGGAGKMWLRRAGSITDKAGNKGVDPAKGELRKMEVKRWPRQMK